MIVLLQPQQAALSRRCQMAGAREITGSERVPRTVCIYHLASTTYHAQRRPVLLKWL